MKKFILSVATVALLFAAVPSQATAKNPAPATVNLAVRHVLEGMSNYR